MHSFENIVAEILSSEGYWVHESYKVNLTKEDKNKIGRTSSPRWELDIIAFKGSSNELLVVECKSYLDSKGVNSKDFYGLKTKDRYKLFNDETLRKVVLNRLKFQLSSSGACPRKLKIKLCLACGKIYEKNRIDLHKKFSKEGWKLFDESWILEHLERISKSSYEDKVASIVSKLIFRAK